MKRPRALAFVLFVFATSCGGGGDTTAPDKTPTPVVTTVTVSGTASVNVGSTVALSALASDASGNPMLDKTAFAWSSGTTGVASVSASGGVTGVAAGTAAISATIDGKSGSLTVTVVAVVVTPTVASVTITGTTAVQAGQSTKLTAVAKDAGGTVLAVPMQWSSTDGTLISVASDGTVTASRIGVVTITATAGGVSATTQFTSSLTPYTFVFAATTTAADQQTIKDGVQYAHAYHQTIFSRQIQQPTTITTSTTAQGCAQGGAAAFTGPNATTYCIANPGWLANGPVLRMKIVMHETFHIWQFEYHWLGTPANGGATWVVEGSAELMGFHGIADRGMLGFQTAIGCQVKQMSDFALQNPPGLPALSLVETPQAFQTTVGPLYAKSMLAMDQLTALNGLVSLKAYGDAIAAGTAWPVAFQSAFGQSTAAFYAQFPAYTAGLSLPINYQCGV
jgi:hypothetical protein